MKDYIFSKIKLQKYSQIFVDILFIYLSIFIAYFFTFALLEQRPFRLSHFLDRLGPWTVILIFYIFVFYLADLYEESKIKDAFRFFVTVTLCVFTASFISSGILFFLTKYVIGRRVIIIHIPLVIVFLMLRRFMFIYLILKREKPLRLALIGNSKIISHFIDEFFRMGLTEFRITQICITDMGKKNKPSQPESLPASVSVYERIEDILENEDFDILAFDYTQLEMSREEIRQILQLKFQDKYICDFPSFYEDLTGKIPLSFVDSRWILSDIGFQGKISKFHTRMKRLFDILFSTILLIMTFPLCVFIAIAIKIDSKGKLIFPQERLGLRKQPFICYKFRTMRMGAEEETGPTWASEDDPRVTRIGKMLRKIHLDELPQLWNILKGEMSFVGNRPYRKYFIDKLAKIIPYFDLRFSVKPGLTGWAQVHHDSPRSQEAQFEKFNFELFYIKKMSIFLDLFIIFKTIKTAIQRKGE